MMTKATNKVLLGMALATCAFLAVQTPARAMFGAKDPVRLHQKDWKCPDASSDLAVDSAPAKIGGTITNTGLDQTVQVQVFDKEGNPVGPPKMLDPDAIIVVPAGGSAKVTDVDDKGNPETPAGDGLTGSGVFNYQFL